MEEKYSFVPFQGSTEEVLLLAENQIYSIGKIRFRRLSVFISLVILVVASYFILE